MAKTVQEIMNPELFSLRPDDAADQALGYILALGVSGAPVLDATGKPVGVVSFRDLCRRQAGSTVAEIMTAPAVTVSGASKISEAARLLAERGFHRLVVVDPEGHCIGIVSVLDVMRALIGMPISHPDAFPHYDKITGLSWTDDTLVDLEHVDRAPDGPGLLMLRVGGTRVPETVVWIESANNLRTRLYELISLPQDNRRLRRLFESYGSELRFRAAAAPDPQRRKQALDAFLGHSDGWLGYGARA